METPLQRPRPHALRHHTAHRNNLVTPKVHTETKTHSPPHPPRHHTAHRNNLVAPQIHTALCYSLQLPTNICAPRTGVRGHAHMNSHGAAAQPLKPPRTQKATSGLTPPAGPSVSHTRCSLNSWPSAFSGWDQLGPVCGSAHGGLWQPSLERILSCGSSGMGWESGLWQNPDIRCVHRTIVVIPSVRRMNVAKRGQTA